MKDESGSFLEKRHAFYDDFMAQGGFLFLGDLGEKNRKNLWNFLNAKIKK